MMSKGTVVNDAVCDAGGVRRLEFRRNLSAVGVEGIFLNFEMFPRDEASEIPFSAVHQRNGRHKNLA